MRFRSMTVAVAAAMALASVPADAQESEEQDPSAQADGWNSSRALELIERARARRLMPSQDSALRNYTAHAEGFVYFFLDRRESEERTLIKTDQVALDLWWAPPDRTRQRIVGLRDESRFPNLMYYHLDHLTVVQNGFGDVIRMGDGDEVQDVPHPAARGSETVYDFRLADSLTIQLPAAAEPIRVYEIEVRPRRTDQPAIVGSIFVDRATADIVRLSFTFTPASYVDRRLDYITVSLDNGLWEGRYWLPNEQTLEIRRQLPELDFAAGAVIQGRMRITDYTFNDSLPEGAFYGPAVTTAPASEREQYPFERGLYDDLDEAGLAPPPDLADIRREAVELLGDVRLSGLPRFRLGIGSVSSAFRFNRAEGITIGAGTSYVPGPESRFDAGFGFALGTEKPFVTLGIRRGIGTGNDAHLALAIRRPADLGLRPALPTAINTIAALAFGRDYTDPYYATGGRLFVRVPLEGDLRIETELVAERHASASLTQESAPLRDSEQFRPVRAIDDGDLSAFAISIERPLLNSLTSGWGAGARVEVGAFAEGAYLRPSVHGSLQQVSEDHAARLLLEASAGLVTEEAPSQRLFVFGGQNTLPGYDHRIFAGRAYALANAEATLPLFHPFVSLRLLGAAGVAGGLPTRPDVPPPDARAWMTWDAGSSDGIRTSVGAGLSLFWDLLRLDAVRGLQDGRWQFLIGFHRDFWDIS